MVELAVFFFFEQGWPDSMDAKHGKPDSQRQVFLWLPGYPC
jgi:hypothetical protein